MGSDSQNEGGKEGKIKRIRKDQGNDGWNERQENPNESR